jgi:hypothetical protein
VVTMQDIARKTTSMCVWRMGMSVGIVVAITVHDIALGQGRAAPTVRPVTAAEEIGGARLYASTGFVLDGSVRSTRDDFDAVLAQRARAWVLSLQRERVRGIQLDPMGQLLVVAGEEALAQEQFRARLSTPGLPVLDRAYTLLAAVRAFSADPDSSARMRIALEYVREIDRSPEYDVLTKYVAHARIGRAFYQVGNGSVGLAHIDTAFMLLPAIPFERREWIIREYAVHSLFILAANVLSGRADGSGAINALGKRLLPYTMPEPSLLAHDTRDSLLYKKGMLNTAFFTGTTLRMAGHLGKPAPAVVGTTWWNTPEPATMSAIDSGAREKSFADGKIRVTEYGDKSCLGCVLALPRMEALSKKFPAAEMWYVTHGAGVWGATPCTPAEETAHLERFYTVRKKLTFPIALWIGGRVNDIDGGSGVSQHPTFVAYPIHEKPWFVVTDGRGIIRHISLGFSETLLSNAVNYLLAESRRSDGASASASH